MAAPGATTALFSPRRPRLAEALSAITGLDLDVAREIVAAGPLTWSEQNGLEWRVPGARGAPELRWTGPLRSMFRSSQEAWETLAARGIIPDAWAAEAQRRFYGTERRALPLNVREALVFASDPEGIAEAEALGREVALRLAAWNPPRPQAVVWRVLDDARADVVPNLVAGGRYFACLAVMLGMSPLAVDPVVPTRPTRRRVVAWTPPTASADAAHRAMLRVAETWRRGKAFEAVERVEVASSGNAMSVEVPRGWWGRRVGDLDDPFEPAEQLWRMGYGLLDVNRSSVVLAAARV